MHIKTTWGALKNTNARAEPNTKIKKESVFLHLSKQLKRLAKLENYCFVTGAYYILKCRGVTWRSCLNINSALVWGRLGFFHSSKLPGCWSALDIAIQGVSHGPA